MLRIKTTFGAHETNAIDAVPFFEMAYFFTDGLDGSRTIGTENDWEFGGHVKLLSKTAFPLERIPDADTGSLHAYKNFVRIQLRHRKLANLHFVQTAKPIDRHRLHRFINGLIHRTSSYYQSNAWKSRGLRSGKRAAQTAEHRQWSA